ncbi:MAG: phosphate ABC transporter permease [Nitrospirae bacterium RBG_13_39_12]|nr:MAG: phosphate ABC transporter permease [Nitrospirae bacterium RBG_13_39_12]
MIQNNEIVIKPRKGWVPVNFRELWAFRELLYFLAWRDIKVKYKQTVLGAAWAILQPFTTMIVFSILFGKLAKVPSDGIPYPIFVYAGLLPWNYFSSALSNSGNSLVASSNLITKVYFPRLIIPASASLSGLVDFIIASAILIGMMFFYHFTPNILGVVMIPVLIFLIFIVAVSCGLLLSALNVEYRDFQHVIPFIVQIWMFVTPVIYPVTLFPEKYRWLLSLNPMSGFIEAFRAATLGHQPINWNLLTVSLVVTFVMFIAGIFYFKKVERSFADVI